MVYEYHTHVLSVGRATTYEQTMYRSVVRPRVIVRVICSCGWNDICAQGLERLVWAENHMRRVYGVDSR